MNVISLILANFLGRLRGRMDSLAIDCLLKWDGMRWLAIINSRLWVRVPPAASTFFLEIENEMNSVSVSLSRLWHYVYFTRKICLGILNRGLRVRVPPAAPTFFLEIETNFNEMMSVSVSLFRLWHYFLFYTFTNSKFGQNEYTLENAKKTQIFFTPPLLLNTYQSTT